MSSVSIETPNAEVKRRLAARLGTDPTRYDPGIGGKRDKRLTAEEIDRICEELGIGFVDGTKDEKRDTIMIKLGRDRRTGVTRWDAADVVAVVQALEEADA